MIIYGIPSSGKTTIARLLAKSFELEVKCSDKVYKKIAKHINVSKRESGNPKHWYKKKNIDTLKERYYKILQSESQCIYEGYGFGFKKDRSLIKDNGPIFFLYIDYKTWLERKGVEDSPERKDEYEYLNSIIEHPDDYYFVNQMLQTIV
jgi:shikimate kinase